MHSDIYQDVSNLENTMHTIVRESIFTLIEIHMALLKSFRCGSIFLHSHNDFLQNDQKSEIRDSKIQCMKAILDNLLYTLYE